MKAKKIRNITDRPVPAVGTLGHRSRGKEALAWGPHSTSPPAAAFTEPQARARVRRSRTRIALAPPDTIQSRRRMVCSWVGLDSVSYWHNHRWRQVELADTPGKTSVIKGGDGLAIAATGVMQGVGEFDP